MVKVIKVDNEFFTIKETKLGFIIYNRGLEISDEILQIGELLSVIKEITK